MPNMNIHWNTYFSLIIEEQITHVKVNNFKIRIIIVFHYKKVKKYFRKNPLINLYSLYE